MSEMNERSVASDGSVADRPLGDPEIAVEILKLRVAELEEAAHAEIARLRLTDEERAVIEKACSSLERDDRFYENEAASLRATLERLLERTK